MLKKFYLKLFLFFVWILIIICIFMRASTKDEWRIPIARFLNCEDYITVNNGPDEIKPYIDKVRGGNEDTYTKLIIGDSVCHQMYNDLQDINDDICIVGSNGAITMSGQYILLYEFLENHKNVTDVWLILIPGSFSRHLDNRYGYQYAVMPFVEKGCLTILDDDTILQMKEIYGDYALNLKFVEFVDKSAIGRKVYLNYIKNTVRNPELEFISPLGEKYLYKMKYLCDEKNVNLHLLSGPLSDIEEKHIYVEQMQEDYKIKKINRIFPEFFDSIVYYPEEQYRDGTHFGGVYATRESFNEKIREMYPNDDLIKYLILND